MAPDAGAPARIEVLHVPPAASQAKVPLARQEKPTVAPDASFIAKGPVKRTKLFPVKPVHVGAEADQNWAPVVGG
jgi:hypothetical protein